MKTKQLRRRKLATIDTSRWASYATAGVATALASSTEATIHYVGVNETFSAPVGEIVADTFAIGSNDSFYIRHHQPASGYGAARFILFGNSASFNGIANGDYRYASKLASGANISALPFIRNRTDGMGGYYLASLAFGLGYANSQWLKPGTGFVGFRFNDGAGVQYGWIRIEMLDGAPLNNFKVIDYAFGDVGDHVVAGQVPEPGSLGLLALGGLGLMLWRKRRSKALV